MTLEEWKELNGWSYRKLADILSLSHDHLYRLCKFQKSPSVDLAYRIEKMTNGVVPMVDIVKPSTKLQYSSKRKFKLAV